MMKLLKFLKVLLPFQNFFCPKHVLVNDLTRGEVRRKEKSMKKTLFHLVLFAFLVSLCSVMSYAGDVDLTGAWKGSTEVPDQGTDELILVIKREGGGYTATLSDSLGMVQEAECEDIEFKEGILTFNFTIPNGYESMTVWMTLKVEGDKMSGYWETEDGSQGEVNLEKEK